MQIFSLALGGEGRCSEVMEEGQPSCNIEQQNETNTKGIAYD